MSSLFEDMRDKAKLVFSSSEQQQQQQPDNDVEEQQQPDRLEELSEYCPKLTFQQRLIGFAVSFSLGYLIAFFSFRFFLELVVGNPGPFAINYTFGHVFQLCASMFLCGPKRQFKNMFDDTRRTTSIVYLSCLFATLFVVFFPYFPGALKLILLLLLTMTQFSASLWYSLSYIPYGRRTFLRMLKNALGIEESGGSAYAGIGSGS